ncbi:MAG: glutamate--tRNA ligase, partial [bacterium]
LEKMRKEAQRKGLSPGYDGRCRNLTEEKISEYEREKRKYVLRLKVPKEKIEINDLIRGKVIFEGEHLKDFVIMKSDGTPTFNFAVVIDDYLMKITHVIRGEDHLSNTPKQIQVYNALNKRVPIFIHIPMILGPDKAKLSKRHGATSIGEYKDMGFPSEAMINFLALMGASYNDKQILTKEELIELFSLERLTKNPAIFDMKKLEFLSQEHIRRKEKEELLESLSDFLIEKGLKDWTLDRKYLLSVIGLLQPRVKTLNDFISIGDFFFIEDFRREIEPFDREKISDILSRLNSKLALLEDWRATTIETCIRGFIEEESLDSRGFLQSLRIIVTGKKVTPSLFETLELIGKSRVIDRIKRFTNKIENV